MVPGGTVSGARNIVAVAAILSAVAFGCGDEDNSLLEDTGGDGSDELFGTSGWCDDHAQELMDRNPGLYGSLEEAESACVEAGDRLGR